MPQDAVSFSGRTCGRNGTAKSLGVWLTKPCRDPCAAPSTENLAFRSELCHSTCRPGIQADHTSAAHDPSAKCAPHRFARHEYGFVSAAKLLCAPGVTICLFPFARHLPGIETGNLKLLAYDERPARFPDLARSSETSARDAGQLICRDVGDGEPRIPAASLLLSQASSRKRKATLPLLIPESNDKRGRRPKPTRPSIGAGSPGNLTEVLDKASQHS